MPATEPPKSSTAIRVPSTDPWPSTAESTPDMSVRTPILILSARAKLPRLARLTAPATAVAPKALRESLICILPYRCRIVLYFGFRSIIWDSERQSLGCQLDAWSCDVAETLSVWQSEGLPSHCSIPKDD